MTTIPNFETRMAAVKLVRTRFAGRNQAEREAQRSHLGLVELEVRLGLADAHAFVVAQREVRCEDILRAARAPVVAQRWVSQRLESARRREAYYSNSCSYGAGLVAELAQAEADAARWGALLAPTSPTTRLVWPQDPAPAQLPLAARLAAYKARRAEGRRLAAQARLEPTVRDAYAACGYRTCTVGHTTTVMVADAFSVAAKTESDWTKRNAHKSYKYPEHVSVHVVRVRADWLERVAAVGAQVADGHLVLDFDASTGEATWVEQSRGTGLSTVEGWLVRVGAEWRRATSERARRRLMVEGCVADVAGGEVAR